MKINVLDKGYVELVDRMGDDLSVVNAARVSFNKVATAFTDRDRDLVRYLLQHGHTSPMRHCMMTFRVKAPIFVFRQWMKHRIGSEFNEVSSRYVELGDAEFYVPEVFRLQSVSNKQGSHGELAHEANCHAVFEYENAMEYSQAQYDYLREKGVAKEQARCVMPVAQYSEVIWTVSLQAVMHFLDLRLDSHAQWEIRQFAKAVRSIVSELFPVVVSEYERVQHRKLAEKEISQIAIKLALTDTLYEIQPDNPEIPATLDSLRGELRNAVATHADAFAEFFQRS